jgi:hypothetical protein
MDEDAGADIEEGAQTVDGRWATQSRSVIEQKSEKIPKTKSAASRVAPPGYA